jgi:transmembrane sensor
MSRSPHARAHDDALVQQAAECLLCLTDPGASAEERSAWTRWLDADPAHRAAYARLDAVWRAPVDPARIAMPTAAELAADRDDPNQTLPLPPFVRRAPRLQLRMVGSLAAALLLAALLVWALLPQMPASGPVQLLHTARGETRTERLADGSTLVLGAETELELRFDSDARRLTLRNGEALFHVASDKTRPFTVTTSDGEIRAVGTVFGIRRSAGGTTVTVIEGVVLVRPQLDTGRVARLTHGQQVAIDKRLGSIRAVDPAAASAWVDGRLSYVDAPLRDVLTDVARYAQKRVQFDAHAVRELRYTGTVFTSDIDGWIATLPRVFPLKVSSSATESRLRARDAAD